MPTKRKVWKEPLMRILEGHVELLQAGADIPGLGKLPALGRIPELESLAFGDVQGPSAASPAVAIVVVVVCVAVAARPGAVTSDELLRAKLLDVYTPGERRALLDALRAVRERPDLVEATIGVKHTELGKHFMANVGRVEAALH